MTPSSHAGDVWRALRQAEPRGSVFLPVLLSANTHAELTSCCRLAHQLYVDASAVARAFRRDRWHTWCNDMEHRAKLFRWVRAAPPTPSTQVSPIVTGTPDMRLSEAHAWWSKLWDPDLKPAPDTSRFGQCLAEWVRRVAVHRAQGLARAYGRPSCRLLRHR